ncbi:MAG: hypothetical protein EBY16_02475 [Gammaproteobacteria bacterium]|nr:hypothetical protein [Gammaproteobacteria bacterium]
MYNLEEVFRELFKLDVESINQIAPTLTRISLLEDVENACDSLQCAPELNKEKYKQAWLDYPGSKLECMIDGKLPALVLNALPNSEALNDNIRPLIEFVYVDDFGKMSTLSLFMKGDSGSLCGVVCHDPFHKISAVMYGTFDLTHENYNSKAYIDAFVKRTIKSPIILRRIQDLCSKLPTDVVPKDAGQFDEVEKKKFSVDVERDLVEDSLQLNHLWNPTLDAVNHRLWDTPSMILDPKFANASILEVDKPRTSFYPSATMNDDAREYFSRWEQAVQNGIPYFQGMMDATYRLAKPPEELGKFCYELRLNFVYKNKDGAFASYGFYLDPVKNKCFLICCHNPIEKYSKQQGLVYFPQVDKSLSSNLSLEDVIKNEEIVTNTQILIAKINELRAKAFDSEFGDEDTEQNASQLLEQGVFSERFQHEIKALKKELTETVFKLEKPLLEHQLDAAVMASSIDPSPPRNTASPVTVDAHPSITPPKP